MRDLKSLAITVIGIIIFIALLPTLMWLAFILLIIIGIFIIYSRYKWNRMMKDAQKQYENAGFYQEGPIHEDNRINPDVIDVEYSEREEDDV